MTRETLRLTIDVTYEMNGASLSDLRDNLLKLTARAMNKDMFTDGTDAVVVIANPKVEVRP